MKNCLIFFLFLASTLRCKESFGVTINVATQNARCNVADGFAIISLFGGIGNYSYQWSTGATADSIGGLAAGTYGYTVTPMTTDTVYSQDFQGVHGWTINRPCGVNGPLHNLWMVSNNESGQPIGSCGQRNMGNKTLFITSPLNPVGAMYDDEGAGCGGAADANTNVAAISPAINTTGKSNLTLAFDYIGGGVGLTDNASLYFTVNGVMTTLSPSLKSTACGTNEGIWTRASFQLPTSCENVPSLVFTFRWTNNGNCSTGSNQSIAIYNVLLTALTPNLGSATVGSAIIRSGNSVGVDLTNMTIAQPSCNSSNGNVLGLDGKNGVRTYSFFWDSAGVIKSTVAGLINVYAGNYNFHITDQYGCTFDTSFSLTNAPLPNFSNAPDSVCFGDSVGIKASRLHYGMFTWTGFGATITGTNRIVVHPTQSGYCTMNWTSANCVVTDSVFVYVRPLPTLLVTPINPTICSGDTAMLTASGGVGGSYTWSGGDLAASTTNNSLNAHPATNQTYQVQWADNYCHTSTTASVLINTAPTTVQVTAIHDSVCAGSAVTLTAQASLAGGNYTWTGGDLSSSTSGQTLSRTPLNNETYSVSWSKGGCNGSATHSIHVTNINLSVQTVQQPNCGLANGSINITVRGIGARAQLQWFKNGSLFQSGVSSLENLSPGIYSFIASDLSANCTDSITRIVLRDSSGPVAISRIQLTNQRCFGDGEGTAAVTVTGGSGHYLYSWSNNLNSATNKAINLQQGVRYNVSISDGVCAPVDTVLSISGPTAPLAINTGMTSDTCSRGIGSITAHVTGGTAGYTYNWIGTNFKGNKASGLTGQQRYHLAVTDGNGCKDTASTFVSSSKITTVQFTADSICKGSNNGAIQLIPVSNNGPFTYDWAFDANFHGNNATGLAEGTYPVTVTDKGGCPTALQAVLPEYNSGTISMTNDTTIYAGQTVQVKAQTNLPASTVSWSPFAQTLGDGTTAILDPSESTKYTVSFTSAKGCIISQSIQVNVVQEAAEVVVPNIFTPNGDGVNDFFYVNHQNIKTMRTEIFDRWGNKVYEATDPNFKWDGTDHTAGNQAMNTAVLSYVIEYTTFQTTEPKILSGNLTLVK